jgi:hypothetical protein
VINNNSSYQQDDWDNLHLCRISITKSIGAEALKGA